MQTKRLKRLVFLLTSIVFYPVVTPILYKVAKDKYGGLIKKQYVVLEK